MICQMHIGISLCMSNCNLLSYVACCPWLVFLPPSRKSQICYDNGDTNVKTITIATRPISFIRRLASLVTLVMVSAMIAGNVWYEMIATEFSTESRRLIWGTLLQNRWNVFIGAEEVSKC